MEEEKNNIDKYPSVLTAKHIQEILGVGENKAYDLLNSGEFHIVKIGRMLKVSRDVFFKWLEG